MMGDETTVDTLQDGADQQPHGAIRGWVQREARVGVREERQRHLSQSCGELGVTRSRRAPPCGPEAP